MQVGVISDVHANLPALEAVLDDMPEVERVVCVGDVIGYNPWPAECLERVRAVADATVQGNHDRTVETPSRYSGNRMAEAGLEHAKAELSAEQLEWLRELPWKVTFGDDDTDDPEYELVHSHPAGSHRGTYVYPREFASLDRYLDDAAGVVIGHTHVQHAETVDDRLVLNPGSVGQPRDGDPDAAYAVVDVADRTADLRRVSYDIDRVIEAIEDADLPVQTGTRLLEGQ